MKERNEKKEEKRVGLMKSEQHFINVKNSQTSEHVPKYDP